MASPVEAAGAVPALGRGGASSRATGGSVWARGARDGNISHVTVDRPIADLSMLYEFVEPGESRAEDPRDLHLGDADPLGDLTLRQLLAKPQFEDAALPHCALPGRGVDAESDKKAFESRVRFAHRVHNREALIIGGFG
jgi:hypothetical protein